MRLYLNERDGLIYNVINRALDTPASLRRDATTAERQQVFLSVEDIVDGLWEQVAACVAPSAYSTVTRGVPSLSLPPDIATFTNDPPRIMEMILHGHDTAVRIQTATEPESGSETASSSNIGSPRVVDSDLEGRVDSTRVHA